MVWHEYEKEDPPDEMIGEMLRVKVNSIVWPGYQYETEAKWSGTCFMILDDENDPESWRGPLKLVTHWAYIE